MKATVIPVVIDALGKITKGLVQGLEDLEIRGRVDSIQNTASLRSAKILKIVTETCCPTDSSEKPSANVGVKNSKIYNKRITKSRPDDQIL